ncbi:thioredoxin family protein [Paenibacillus peoriae]|nr:thioredoxin family protein [Paenibacillus peoriae]MEC0182431.1 thioredoxin family protein [Paenibacillus peoriae]
MMEVQEITSIEEIEPFIQKNRLSILYVSREDCSVCHAIYPKIKELLRNYSEIKLAHIEASQVAEVAGKFLIFSVPAIIVFLDQKEYFREGRFVQFDRLATQLQQMYSMI